MQLLRVQRKKTPSRMQAGQSGTRGTWVSLKSIWWRVRRAKLAQDNSPRPGGNVSRDCVTVLIRAAESAILMGIAIFYGYGVDYTG